MVEAQSNVGEFSFAKGLMNLEYTLSNGQMFRWRKSEGDWWEAVTGARLLRLRLAGSDAEDHFEFETYPGEPDFDLLHHFFRLDVDLEALYTSWLEADPYLGALGSRFAGLRIVRQEPEECLLSFVCSTANFIPNIMRSIATISRAWGTPIVSSQGKVVTHSFPHAEVLAQIDPVELAEKSGLEWRAANLAKVARQIAAKPSGWLEQVGKLDYESARGELMRLEGVGPKIADCVCLFAMAKDQAVPVDTHVWQLTRERYLPTLKGKSVSPNGYAQVLSFFQSRFEKAGWAQQYLFYDHLLESRAKSGRK